METTIEPKPLRITAGAGRPYEIPTRAATLPDWMAVEDALFILLPEPLRDKTLTDLLSNRLSLALELATKGDNGAFVETPLSLRDSWRRIATPLREGKTVEVTLARIHRGG